MSTNSILFISSDEDVAKAVTTSLEDVQDFAVDSEASSLSQMNGAAVKMAADHDVVLFSIDPSNAQELLAVETLTDERKPGTVYLALTDGDLPFSKVRALTKAGVDDVLPYPLADEELTSQIKSWIDKRKQEVLDRFSGDNAAEGKVIAVQQARGGIGATTVAVNLADQLLERKGFKKTASNRVVIVDFDIQFGTVGDFLDVDNQEGLLQLASESFLPDAMWIEQSLTRLPSGLAVLAAPQSFVPLEAIDPQQVESLIRSLKSMFDYVVIDMPRALVNWIEPVLAECDRFLIVSDMSVPSIRATRRLMDFVLADNTQLPVEIVINHEKKPMFLATHHKEASKAIDMPFDIWIAHDSKTARMAVDHGKPLSEVAGRSDIAKGIAALAKAMLQALPKGAAQERV